MQMNIKSLLSMRMDVLYCIIIIIIIIIIITIWYHTYQGTIGTTGGTHRYFIKYILFRDFADSLAYLIRMFRTCMLYISGIALTAAA